VKVFTSFGIKSLAMATVARAGDVAEIRRVTGVECDPPPTLARRASGSSISDSRSSPPPLGPTAWRPRANLRTCGVRLRGDGVGSAGGCIPWLCCQMSGPKERALFVCCVLSPGARLCGTVAPSAPGVSERRRAHDFANCLCLLVVRRSAGCDAAHVKTRRSGAGAWVRVRGARTVGEALAVDPRRL
jgi:hypothetical protein